jgi:putative addiction module component (TIGR02574 family)
MSEKAKTILAEALELGERDRAEIAGSLLRSLEPSPGEDVEAAWREEVRLRLAELDAGTTETVTWDVVRDELLTRLSGL